MKCNNPQCREKAELNCPYCDSYWCSDHKLDEGELGKCPDCGNELEPLPLRNKYGMPYTAPFQ